MGSAISTCTKLLNIDSDFDYMQDDAYYPGGRNARGSQQEPAGPQLALRIVNASIEASTGVRLSPFAQGDEVAVAVFEKVKGWEPLRWRQERSAKQRAAMDNSTRLLWPQGPRFSNAQRFWGAKVISADGRGGFEEHWCLLQVAVNPRDRTMENVRADIEDAKDVASYAHRFNMQTARCCFGDVDPESVPGIRVCAPVGCSVLGSAVPDLVKPGEAVSLTMFPAPQVRKFVFEGGEDFLELPQAFFHYVAWVSGGRELVGDLQGIEDGDDVILVDPVVLRAAQPTIGNLLSALASPDPLGEATDPSDQRFDLWHPRCGQLCQAFDPLRRTAQSRKHCGLNLPSCGVGGA